MDTRRLYIKQLLQNYKEDDFSPKVYTVNYRTIDDKNDRYKMFGHNNGIDFVIGYIRELENKIDELQHIERIIELARQHL